MDSSHVVVLRTTHGVDVDLDSSLNWVRTPDILSKSSVSNKLIVLRFRVRKWTSTARLHHEENRSGITSCSWLTTH